MDTETSRLILLNILPKQSHFFTDKTLSVQAKHATLSNMYTVTPSFEFTNAHTRTKHMHTYTGFCNPIPCLHKPSTCRIPTLLLNIIVYHRCYVCSPLSWFIGCRPTSSSIIYVRSRTEKCLWTRNYNQADGKGAYRHGDKCNWFLKVQTLVRTLADKRHVIFHSLTRSLAHSLPHPLIHSPTLPLTHSPTHPLTHSPTHPLTHSPTHPRHVRCVTPGRPVSYSRLSSYIALSRIGRTDVFSTHVLATRRYVSFVVKPAMLCVSISLL